jgi:hypothetical protein
MNNEKPLFEDFEFNAANFVGASVVKAGRRLHARMVS